MNTYAWNGQTYRGAAAVAAAAGVHECTVHKHMSKYGDLRLLGVRAYAASNPYEWEGQVYHGAAAVAAAAGVSECTVHRHMSKYGDLRLLSLGVRHHGSSNPYEWNGQIYRGAAAVASAAGVHVNTVHRHLNRSGDLFLLGMITKGVACRVSAADGREWPTQAAFARYCGVSQSTVSIWMSGNRTDLMIKALARADAQRALK